MFSITKEKLPNIPLPPEPIVTRWGTWLEAAGFYAEYYDQFCQVINELDEDAAISIAKVKELISKNSLKNELLFIKNHFLKLATYITKLEERNLELTQSIALVRKCQTELSEVPSVEVLGSVGKKVYEKFNYVLQKNSGFDVLSSVCDTLNGANTDLITITSGRLNSDAIAALKNAPITSCDVERSFSDYKYILDDRRQSFSTDNIEKYLVTYYHNRRTKSLLDMH